MPTKQLIIGFPSDYDARIVSSDYIPMSERIRAYTDEAQALDTVSDFSYDDASADMTDPAIDFHYSALDIAEMKLGKVRAESKPKDEPKPDSMDEPKPAEPAGDA